MTGSTIPFVPGDLDRLCANAIRALAMDGVQQAESGHPGMPMGMADAAYVLWTQFLKHNPSDPAWPERDRFILSAGHGSMLLYSLLHLTGYDLPLDELKRFRQWDGRTAGHPERGWTPGVEVTTGPLGQGFGNGVGCALAERYLAAQFNRPGFELVNHYTYAICSDGDLMEGISHEAASLAGHLKLGKLIYLYDDNKITIDGSTDLSFSEDVPARFAAYGWHVQQVDGHDMAAVAAALQAARAETERPSLICCRTVIGFGSPNRAGTSKAHGEPLGKDEVVLAKRALGWPEDRSFYVPDEVYTQMRSALEQGGTQQHEWQQLFERYRAAHPELAARWEAMWSHALPADWAAVLPSFPADAKGMATRAASGQTLNALAPHVPALLGGSADLHHSNNTLIKGAEPIQANHFAGRNLYLGVREHGMGALMNGMAAHGGLIPYGGTFLVFSDYLRPTMRLAALQDLQVIYVFTHDSIGLGEDGPTHQPIEHLAALRAIPFLHVIRPADAAETAQAWRAALEYQHGPTALILTRQALPTIDRSTHGPAEGLLRGAYVLREVAQPQVILIGTGSEVAIALGAADLLAERGIAARVVSMPCWELFTAQDQDYRDSVLPPTISARVAVEAAATLGWERWVGTHGRVVGIDRFGASAPYKRIYEEYGLTAANVADIAASLLQH